MNETLISKDVPRNFLLVEGSDDVNVCFHLLKCYQIQVPKQIAIVNKEGIENLLHSLEVELIASGPRRLGILVDADEDLVTRWQSLSAILKDSGYTMPSHPLPEGTIIEQEDKPTVGIWLMPNNQLPGMLEHFCSFMIPTEDRLWHTANNILQEVVKQDRRFPEQHQIKAHIHTWLAWQKEPGKPMGQAITKRFFDHTTPHAQQFMDWIRRLYDIDQR